MLYNQAYARRVGYSLVEYKPKPITIQLFNLPNQQQFATTDFRVQS